MTGIKWKSVHKLIDFLGKIITLNLTGLKGKRGKSLPARLDLGLLLIVLLGVEAVESFCWMPAAQRVEEEEEEEEVPLNIETRVLRQLPATQSPTSKTKPSDFHQAVHCTDYTPGHSSLSLGSSLYPSLSEVSFQRNISLCEWILKRQLCGRRGERGERQEDSFTTHPPFLVFRQLKFIVGRLENGDDCVVKCGSRRGFLMHLLILMTADDVD